MHASVMGALTEAEIFDRMLTSFRTAAELCDDLARAPLKGLIYNRLRGELRLIEGCCKQASTWREDTRWLPIGKLMAECHQKAGDWLRGIKQEDGTRVKIAEGTLHPAFRMLADNLRALEKVAQRIRSERTNRVGMILPPMGRAPTRTEGRQMQVMLPPGMRATSSGLIVPQGTAVQ